MAVYMKIDGAEGSVNAGGYEKWIKLDTVQTGVSRHYTTRAGRGANRESRHPDFAEIVVSKPQDNASRALCQKALESPDGDKVTIDIVTTSDGITNKIMRIEVENTLISSFSCSGHGGDAASRPMESLSLNFTKIQWEFVSQAKAGSEATDPFKTGFDLATAKKL